MAPDPYDFWSCLENEVTFKKFYLSCEPATTPNYPLDDYYKDVEIRLSRDREMGVFVRKSSTTEPGDMLIVENTVVSCACIRYCSPLSKEPSTHAPTIVLSPPLDRLPLQTHEHLANKFVKMITDLEAANTRDEVELSSIRWLDARLQLPGVIPVNAQEGTDPPLPRGKRGPWNEVEAGVQGTLDYDRVWNIIANTAISFNVMSKRREEPSQVETCELWGMWVVPSFIKHSCFPNCHAMRVGDAIIIRAAKSIEDGEELTLPYFDIFQPLCKRKLAAQKWGFSCDCRRCAFECLLGEPYEAIEKQIVNIERQIQNSWAMNLDVEARGRITVRLFEKLVDQLDRTGELVERLELHPKEIEVPFLEETDGFKTSLCCIYASFNATFLAWYALTLREVYDDPFVTSTEKASRLCDLITCVRTILNCLIHVQPGNLFCEEFYSILLKSRDELIDDDIDDENLTADIDLPESYFRVANKFSRCYYGPNVEVFNPSTFDS